MDLREVSVPSRPMHPGTEGCTGAGVMQNGPPALVRRAWNTGGGIVTSLPRPTRMRVAESRNSRSARRAKTMATVASVETREAGWRGSCKESNRLAGKMTLRLNLRTMYCIRDLMFCNCIDRIRK